LRRRIGRGLGTGERWDICKDIVTKRERIDGFAAAVIIILSVRLSLIDRLCGLVVGVSGYITEMCCVSCEV
jgi:hypothetical protein